MQYIWWGIIGCGDVTEVKSGPAFQKCRNSRLVAVMRRTPGLAADYARRHGVPKWYENAEELLADPEVNAVYVATPPDSHCHYTLLAARAGKAVYVEKPMARTYPECQRMIQACKSAGVPLFVAYYRRALPRFVKIKEWLDGGKIGEIRSVLVEFARPLSTTRPLPWRVLPQISGGGYFVDLGSHILDILDYLVAPIAKVSGTAVNQAGAYPAEDSVVAHFTFENGAVGAGSWNFSGNKSVDRVLIVGESGEIEFSVFGHEPLILKNWQGQLTAEYERPAHIQQPLIQTVVNSLTGTGSCPSNGETAARTSRVIDEILKDYRRQHQIQF